MIASKEWTTQQIERSVAVRLRILHVVLSIGETNAAYNEHCLPMTHERDIAICTYYRVKQAPPAPIRLFEGNNSLLGFLRALRAAFAAGDFDVVHVHVVPLGILLLLAKLLWPGKLQAATVYTFHSSYPNYNWRNRLSLLPVFAFFDRSVCCSQASYSSLPPVYRWVGGKRLCVVQNGIDLARVDHYLATQALPLPRSYFRVGAVGRLIASKNPLTLLTAFQQVAAPESRLCFVGEGDLRSALLAQSLAAGKPIQLELTGLIARDQVYGQLAEMDLLVSTSRVEGLPVAVLEAMACRCPVVLSDIPPHREIAAGVDFIPLVAPGDVDGFAQAIKRFQAMPISERRVIGEQCRQLVERHFSLKAMQRGYAAIYADLLPHAIGVRI
jgi:glycosyltransferase involved in cell wall biosynthesis